MTDLKLHLLKALYVTPNRCLDRIKLYELKISDFTSTRYALEELQEKKYIEKTLGTDKFRLTPAGANAYEDECEERNKQAEAKRQYRFNKRTTIISVVVATITTVIAVVEFFFLLAK